MQHSSKHSVNSTAQSAAQRSTQHITQHSTQHSTAQNLTCICTGAKLPALYTLTVWPSTAVTRLMMFSSAWMGRVLITTSPAGQTSGDSNDNVGMLFLQCC
jgi:hypothetical protein